MTRDSENSSNSSVFLGTLGNAWERLGTLGNAWERLGTLGNAWERLGTLFDCCYEQQSKSVRTTSRSSKQRNKLSSRNVPWNQKFLRLEPLEERALLAVLLDPLHGPTISHVNENHVEPWLDAVDVYLSDTSATSAPQASDMPIIAESSVPSGALTGNWGPIVVHTSKFQTFTRGGLFSDGDRTGYFTFTLANTGDINSYIELYGTNINFILEDTFNNDSTSLRIIGNGKDSGKKTGESITISLNGYAPGTYTVYWNFNLKWLDFSVNCFIAVNPPASPVAPPIITVPPKSETYVVGETATALSVTAATNGYGTLSYEWYKDGTAITNATTATLGAASISTSAAGQTQYYCEVTNTLNGKSTSTNSSNAIISVIGAPSITTQPVSATYIVGETATALSVAATRPANLGTLTYQWRISTDGTSWSNISGQTSVNYTPPMTTGTTYYQCVVTNTLNPKSISTTSSNAKIEVIGAPSITTQPVSATYLLNETATTLSVVASKASNDPGAISYQWFVVGNTMVLSTEKDYTPDTKAAKQTQYYCKVINTYGSKSTSINSANVTIGVIGAPSITVQPQPATYTQGQKVVILSVAASITNYDPGTLSYQWQSSPNGTSSWSNISGQISKDYTPPSGAAGTMYYRCSVTNSLNSRVLSVNSDSVKIDVIGSPSITMQPVSAIYWRNDTPVVLSVTATSPANLGSLSYQWYKNGTAIANATTPTLATLSISTSVAGQTEFYCKVTNLLDGKTTSTDSGMATVTVLGITEQPKSGNYAYQENVTLSVTVAGSGQSGITVTYLWQKYYASNSSWGPVGSSRTYTLPTNSAGTEQYRCFVNITMNGVTKEFTTDTATIAIKADKLIFDEVAKGYIYHAGHIEGSYPYAGWTVNAIFGDNENYLGLYAEGLKNSNGEALLVFRGTDISFTSLSNSFNTVLDFIADLDV